MNKVTRENILDKAYHDCMCEMYKKAQPSADFDQLIKDVNDGKIEDGPHNPVYNRYYLSFDEFEYIRDKYIDAYGIREKWTDYLNVVKRYFNGDGRKDVYINETIDEDGFKHRGYRSSESVLHIRDAVNEILKDKIDDSTTISDKIANIVNEYITNCQNYYRFDREESSFSCSVSLGCSPTCCAKSVIEYWKNNGVDIKIEERNPLLFWDMDQYSSYDAFVESMISEYGEDWEHYWWNEYYNTNKGKKKLVTKFITDNRDKLPNYYVSTVDYNTDDDINENKLIVLQFGDESFSMDIDDFINEYNIKWDV